MKIILKKILSYLYRLLKGCDVSLRYENYRKKYNIDETFKFNGDNIILGGEGQIILNENSYIGNYSYIQSGKDAKVKIGKKTSISHNVKIYTTSRKPDQDFLISKKTYTKDVIIGDGVWIGANVFINPGVNIGEGAVIGANSVVTKSLNKNGIYVGIPARLLRYKSHL